MYAAETDTETFTYFVHDDVDNDAFDETSNKQKNVPIRNVPFLQKTGLNNRSCKTLHLKHFTVNAGLTPAKFEVD